MQYFVSSFLCVYKHIFNLHIHMYICLYIHIYRERESFSVCIYVHHMCTWYPRPECPADMELLLQKIRSHHFDMNQTPVLQYQQKCS